MSEPQPHRSSELDDEDEEAPVLELAGLADEMFAVNIRQTRERLKLSQGEIARRMADRGFPFYQQTIRRIEEGRRKVSVGEAKAIAEILDTTVDQLTASVPEADAALAVTVASMSVRASARKVSRAVAALLGARVAAEKVLADTDGAQWAGVQEMREELAKELRAYTLDGSVEYGVMVHRAKQDGDVAEDT
jgi:transcriptional regulator with XRE-family HTH domain